MEEKWIDVKIYVSKSTKYISLVPTILLCSGGTHRDCAEVDSNKDKHYSDSRF